MRYLIALLSCLMLSGCPFDDDGDGLCKNPNNQSSNCGDKRSSMFGS